MRTKKGQTGILSVILGLIIFFTLWGMFFAEWLSYWAQDMVTVNNLSGVEAFLISNINLWVFLGVCLGVIGVMYFGGGE